MTTISKPIGFVTDSTCDLPPDVVAHYGIEVVPVFVNFNGDSFKDDGVELMREDYYRLLPTLRPFPTTSAMSPGMAEEAIGRALTRADHVLVMTAPATLSGIYNAMRLGMAKYPADRVTLIDAGTVTMGLGYQVLLAAQVAEATGSLDAVRDAITRVRAHQRVYAALSTLEFLHRSGRVGWAAAGIGSLLQIKPLLDVRESEVRQLARVRTFSRAVEELIRLVHEQAPLDQLTVLFAADEDAAYALRDRLNDVAPSETWIVRVTPAIGAHIGPGGLGVATVSQAWKA